MWLTMSGVDVLGCHISLLEISSDCDISSSETYGVSDGSGS